MNDHGKTISTVSQQSPRRLKTFWIALATALLVALALLAATYVFQNVIHVVDPARIEPLKTYPGGNGYAIPMPLRGDSAETPFASKARLYENGERLGPPHAQPAHVCSTGKGAYVHWGKSLVFSTSDNSDPRINGRRYHVKLPNATALRWRRVLWDVLAGILAAMALGATATPTGQSLLGNRVCGIYFVAFAMASCFFLAGRALAGTFALLWAVASDLVLSRRRSPASPDHEKERDDADKSFYRFITAGLVLLGACRATGINQNGLYLVFLGCAFVVLSFLIGRRRVPRAILIGLTLFLAAFQVELEIKVTDSWREMDVKHLPKSLAPYAEQFTPDNAKGTVVAYVRPLEKPVEFAIDLSAYDGLTRRYGPGENSIIIAGFDLKNLEVSVPGFATGPAISGKLFHLDKLTLNLEIGANHPSEVIVKLKPKESADATPSLYVGPESCGFKFYPDAVWMLSVNSRARLTFHAVEKAALEGSQ